MDTNRINYIHDLIEFKNVLNDGHIIYQYGKIIGKEMLGDSDKVKNYKVLVVYDVVSYINGEECCSKAFNITPNRLPEKLHMSLLK